MGNEWSKTQVEEHQEGDLSENDSEVGVEVQNGPITQQTRPGVNAIKGTEQVDLKQPVQQDNIITSSQKTIVFSPISNGITSSQPPAQSKLSMTISRPSMGRTTFQPNGPGVGVEKPQVTLGDPLIIQASNVNPVVVQTNSIGIQNQAPSSTGGATVSISEPKPKDISIFERLFKPEKKVQIEVPVQNEEAGITVNNNMGLQSAPPNYDQPIQITDDSKQDSVLVLSSDSPGLSTGEDITDTQTASQSPPSTPQEEVHPIMSFFKTLVSSNKPVPKSEEEVNEPEEKKKDNGGLRKSPTKKEKSKSFSEQILDAEAKGSKKSDSPKSRTLSRLFRQKSQKEEPASGRKITAQTPKDDGKAAKESAPRLRPFWRKASAEPEVQVGKANIDVAASSSGTKAPETQDKSKKPENGKNAKPKIMTFFKQLSVIGDAANPNSEEGKQESTSPPTLDITDGVEVTKNEKTVVTAVIETPPQKNKETAKEKKGSAEKISKQDSRESPEAAGSVQLQLSEPGLVVNGADTAKDGQLKRTEKRQSLGSFFKAIGPKRMCDAEVQTDPVSILPAEKVK
ncbi:Hypothetical predicted protein [Pelobates cultripes]|uniref:Breast carcinoma amplified sequence 1 n=1 Tax=Pelobates cultripes TaxID=61616 RepID=A0AAD1SP28_PELCU|nr:Hypothetical predicted protein [Pelobates cultripes]